MADRDELETVDDRHGTGTPMRSSTSRYELGDELGHGGMGEVLDAHDDQLGRRVAIKRMRAATPSDPQIARFLREARIQGRLDHPAVVPVHELGRDRDGRPFFAMKKLSGTTLARMLSGSVAPGVRKPLLRAFVDVCLAIEFAHSRGVIHRDLKPENIMLGEYGEVYVLDWGVAKVVGEQDGEFLDVAQREHATAAGSVIGTPGYISPEQAKGREIDVTSDVFALGCVLFEILAQQPRYKGKEQRPSERAPDREIPPELDDLCVRATEPDRVRRIATARELGERVQHYLDGDRDLEHRRTLATVHLDRARRALASGDRRIASQEAGRSVALDPTLAGAGEVLGRLLLEPPTELPEEVVASIAEDDATVRAANSTQRLRSHLGYLVALPIVFATAPRGYALALVSAIVASAALAWAGARRRFEDRAATAAVQVVILVIATRLYTPLLLAPGLAAVFTMTALIGPNFDERRTGIVLGAVMVVAVLGTFALEQIGIIWPTLEIGDGAIVMRGLGFGSRAAVIAVICLVVTVLPAIGAMNASAMRRSERAAKRSLFLLAWQLRQLAPEVG